MNSLTPSLLIGFSVFKKTLSSRYHKVYRKKIWIRDVRSTLDKLDFLRLDHQFRANIEKHSLHFFTRNNLFFNLIKFAIF